MAINEVLVVDDSPTDLANLKCMTARGIIDLANFRCVTARGVIDLANFKWMPASVEFLDSLAIINTSGSSPGLESLIITAYITAATRWKVSDRWPEGVIFDQPDHFT